MHFFCNSINMCSTRVVWICTCVLLSLFYVFVCVSIYIVWYLHFMYLARSDEGSWEVRGTLPFPAQSADQWPFSQLAKIIFILKAIISQLSPSWPFNPFGFIGISFLTSFWKSYSWCFHLIFFCSAPFAMYLFSRPYSEAEHCPKMCLRTNCLWD